MAPYASVNGAWPCASNDLPALTATEAVTAGKRLYRFAMKRPFKGKVKVVTGNRHSYIRWGVMYVNAEAGWWRLIHGLSHYCAYQLYPGKKPHSPQHAFLEKTMIAHVVSNGWLEGKLKRPEKPKSIVDKKAVHAARIAKRLAAWEAKKKRAETALRKLNRQRAYYAKALAA